VNSIRASQFEFSVVLKVLHFAFQIADSCPAQRHVYMQISHVDNSLVLRYCSFSSSSSPDQACNRAQGMAARSRS
jgi:hypothetical protein